MTIYATAWVDTILQWFSEFNLPFLNQLRFGNDPLHRLTGLISHWQKSAITRHNLVYSDAYMSSVDLYYYTNLSLRLLDLHAFTLKVLWQTWRFKLIFKFNNIQISEYTGKTQWFQSCLSSESCQKSEQSEKCARTLTWTVTLDSDSTGKRRAGSSSFNVN